MDYRIISIGALAVHELWQHQGAARTPHATTTLITTKQRRILVDPGLPPQVVAARLGERAGIEAGDITDVFLTCFRPEHRWGLGAFGEARWLIAENEREQIGRMLVERFQQETEDEAKEVLRQDIATLKRFEAAPDKLDEHVDLFPLPGYTPGCCGLLLSKPRTTILVAGGAVPTVEHLEAGRVAKSSFSIDLAQESLLEAVEIADAIVPGYDNVVLNRLRP